MIRVAGVEPVTEVEGPARRFALWFQGCSIKCEQCCNPQMLDGSRGRLIDPADLAKDIYNADSDGLTVMGGEPLDQLQGLNQLLDELAKLGYNKDMILFSGFTWQQIEADNEKKETAARFDLLIAGPYIESMSSLKRKWIGSDNQTVHFFSDKLACLKKSWPTAKKEVEIHIDEDGITLNGFPLGDDSEFEKFSFLEKG
ncbi:MAG: 4Fe-4S single cluster domain-containing protein [Candidatus Rifleibacteriota bacterium]